MNLFHNKQALRSIIIFLLFLLNLTIASAAPASTPEQAKNFVQGIGDKVIVIVSSKTAGDSEKENKLNTLFLETVDISWIAKFVAGRYWRESTKEQQDKYLKLYQDFILKSYVSKFRQYTDQKMEINKFLAEEEGDFLVETTISDHDGKSYNVSYKAKQTGNNTFKIYDIIAEGVSLITTQRSEFGSILSRDGMEGLIAKLEQKN